MGLYAPSLVEYDSWPNGSEMLFEYEPSIDQNAKGFFTGMADPESRTFHSMANVADMTTYTFRCR